MSTLPCPAFARAAAVRTPHTFAKQPRPELDGKVPFPAVVQASRASQYATLDLLYLHWLCAELDFWASVDF